MITKESSCSSVSLVTESLVLIVLSTALFSLFELNSRDDIVDTQDHAGGFNGSLVGLELDHAGVPDVDNGHVRDLTSLTINTPGLVSSGCMLGTELGHNTDDFTSSVVSEGTGDNFEGTGQGFVGPLLDGRHVLGLLHQSAGEFHLDGTTTGSKSGVDNDVTSDTEGVV